MLDQNGFNAISLVLDSMAIREVEEHQNTSIISEMHEQTLRHLACDISDELEQKISKKTF